jgi:hypothetical protein
MSNNEEFDEYPNIKLMCDHNHKDLWEQIWRADDDDNFHDSQHLFDEYSFVHFLIGAITFYLLWFLIGNKNYTLMATIALSILFEVEENKITNIMKYVKVDGNIGSGSRLVSNKNIPFKYKKNGKSYTFVTNREKIYRVNKNGKRIKEVKMNELKKYKLPIYRGDSYINIIGDIVSNILGGLAIYAMVDLENADVHIMSFILSIWLLTEYMVPNFTINIAKYSYLVTSDIVDNS